MPTTHFNREDPIHDPFWSSQELKAKKSSQIKPKYALNLSPPPPQCRPQTSLPPMQPSTLLSPFSSPKKSVNFDPLTPQLWDDVTTPIGRGLLKITQASVKYNRSKDSISIESFRGGAMKPSVFRMMIKRVFNVAFSDAEFEAVNSYFDNNNDGCIDGAEFLIKFCKMGFKQKSRIAYNVRVKQMVKDLNDEKYAEMMEIKRVEGLDKGITATFSESDYTSAYAKLRQVAGDYDATSASALSLAGFQGKPMNPGVLRDMLRRTFNLLLTGEEVCAVMSMFDKNKSGVIDGSEFLSNFKKIGFAEKSARFEFNLTSNRKSERHAVDVENKRLAEVENNQALSYSTDFTVNDLSSALAKLSNKAAEYDPTSSAALSLECFQGAAMNPTTFKTLVGIVFDVKLNPEELGALVHEFDRNGDGSIDGSEFLVKFTSLGFVEKSRRFNARQQYTQKLADDLRHEEERRVAKAEMIENAKVDVFHTPSDYTSALTKIRAAAADYDRTSSAAMSLDGFQGKAMQPPMFRDMILKTFGVMLTPREAGAVVHEFDKNGDGSIDGVEFLVKFTSLGFLEKSRRFTQRKLERTRRDAKNKIWWLQKAAEEESKNHKKIDHTFTAEHKVSANGKIKKCAMDYIIDPVNALALQAFQGSSMEPHVFKEMLFRTFRLSLTPGEVGAVMSMFDKNGDGSINGAEFMNTFFRIKHSERTRRRKNKKIKEDSVVKELQVAGEVKERERSKQQESRLIHTASDISTALFKIRSEALRYDRTLPSSMGLSAFQGAPMSPDQFRECLNKSMKVKFTYKEVGALMGVFDKDGDGNIDGAEFLSRFFVIAREEQRKKMGVGGRVMSPSTVKRKPRLVSVGVNVQDDLDFIAGNSSDGGRDGDGGGREERNEEREVTVSSNPWNSFDSLFSPLSTVKPYTPKSSSRPKTSGELVNANVNVDRATSPPPPSLSLRKSQSQKPFPNNNNNNVRATTAPSATSSTLGLRSEVMRKRLATATAGAKKSKAKEKEREKEEVKRETDFFFPVMMVMPPIIMPSVSVRGR